MILEGKVWKFGDDISTDLMIPAEINVRHGVSDEETAQYCMRANRPGWAAQVQKGDIIIAGRSFGCGSARSGARMFKVLGVGAIVTETMSRAFFRNAVHVGMPVMTCKGVSQAFEEGDRARINVETGEVSNLSKGTSLQGEALPAGSPPMEILMAGGLKPFMQQEMKR